MTIEEAQARIEALERDLQILISALKNMPRLEGFHDAYLLASWRQHLTPPFPVITTKLYKEQKCHLPYHTHTN